MRISMKKPVVWADGCSYMGILPLVGVVKVSEGAKLMAPGELWRKTAVTKFEALSNLETDRLSRSG